MQVVPQSSDKPAFREDPEFGKSLKTVLSRKRVTTCSHLPTPLTPPPANFWSALLLYVTEVVLRLAGAQSLRGKMGSSADQGGMEMQEM